jgi:molybdate transport system substrate-binding protein
MKHNVIRLWLGISVLGCAVVGAGCQSAPQKAVAQEVGIAAAADLQFALEELIGEFKRRRPGIEVKTTYGASGSLFAQISNRAPFDLFLSADVEYPRKLVENGFATKDSMFTYAVGHLVLWLPNGLKLRQDKASMETLLDPAINKIAVANPKHAPYGKAAVAALKKLELYDKIENKLVYGDSVAQAAQFVDSGAADAGLIPLSLAKAPALRDNGRYVDVPPDSFPRLDQAGVVLESAQSKQAAGDFRDFMTSAEGKAVLRRYGFMVPGD